MLILRNIQKNVQYWLYNTCIIKFFTFILRLEKLKNNNYNLV